MATATKKRSKASDLKPAESPKSGIVQGGREVTEKERLTGVSRRPDDPLEFSPAHEKLNQKAADILSDLTDLREEAYNAGNSILAQVVKGAERELRVSGLGFVRFNEDDADQRPDKDK